MLRKRVCGRDDETRVWALCVCDGSVKCGYFFIVLHVNQNKRRLQKFFRECFCVIHESIKRGCAFCGYLLHCEEEQLKKGYTEESFIKVCL